MNRAVQGVKKEAMAEYMSKLSLPSPCPSPCLLEYKV